MSSLVISWAMFWATAATLVGAGAFIAVTYGILLTALNSFGL